MTESAFELARSDWSCYSERSLSERGFGGNGREGWARFRILRNKRRFFAQKSIKKMFKIQHLFLIVFGRSWGASWSLLGGQNRPKMGQVGPKTALETIFFEKSEFSRKALKTNEKSIKMSPRGDPKRSKITPRRPQDGLISFFFRFVFCIDFLSLFGAILVSFGGALGSQNPSFWASIFS